MTDSYIREHFNAGAPLIYTETRITLSDLLDRENVTDVDVIKIDTDGYDVKVLLGAERFMRKWPPLLAIVETNFNGDLAQQHSVLPGVDAVLRPLGLSLLDMDVYRYSRAALPSRHVYDIYAPTVRGSIGYCDAYYYDDPLSEQGKLDKWLVDGGVRRCLKLIALYELYGLQDCAAELILTLSQHPLAVALADWDAMLDLLVPENPFGVTSYKDYMAFYREDPSRFFPRNWPKGDAG